MILNLIEYSYNYSKTSGSLWQYYRDETFLDATCGNFPAANNKCPLFKFKQKITSRTVNDGTESVEIMVSLKYLNNFLRFLKMPLISCKINLNLTW